MPRMMNRNIEVSRGNGFLCNCCNDPAVKGRTREKREWVREAKAGMWEYEVEADRIDCECGAC